GHDVRGDLVRFKREERFAFVHELTRLLVPGGDNSTSHRLPNRRNFYFNDHRQIYPACAGLTQRRGRGGFRQQRARFPSCSVQSLLAVASLQRIFPAQCAEDSAPLQLMNWRWNNVGAQISKTLGRARTQSSTR